jgi:hypothetical protein
MLDGAPQRATVSTFALQMAPQCVTRTVAIAQ